MNAEFKPAFVCRRHNYIEHETSEESQRGKEWNSGKNDANTQERLRTPYQAPGTWAVDVADSRPGHPEPLASLSNPVHWRRTTFVNRKTNMEFGNKPLVAGILALSCRVREPIVSLACCCQLATRHTTLF